MKSSESGKARKKAGFKGYARKNPDLPAPKLPSERKRWRGPATDKERNQVYTYALYGATDEDISLVMEMSDFALKTNFRDELTKGRIDAKAKIGQRLYRFAVGDDGEGGRRPNLTALIFLAKTRCGYKETSVVENVHVGENIQIYLPDNGRNDCELKEISDAEFA